ncbi:hypothetical protein [Chryseobacterium sp. CFS15]|uniref:hypothetical protein n=1 Tax=Chryseobacterium sp. CFS15 TaxID=2986946 RepID=UPI0028075127|nr:hypothetical protein [Chryseobacterium sp. CFS15]MDQ8142910.1 hypothetical protein [Chryseobacterium sp. CFS15]
MKNYVIILIFLFHFSCQKKNQQYQPKGGEEIITMNSISNYDSIINLVKTKGDTVAYTELFYHLMDSNEEARTDTLMYYSKIMAEEYNYKKAFLHYFNALCEKNNINPYKDLSQVDISKLPISDKKEALFYLNKMLEKKIITKEQFNSVKK